VYLVHVSGLGEEVRMLLVGGLSGHQKRCLYLDGHVDAPRVRGVCQRARPACAFSPLRVLGMPPGSFDAW